MLYELKDCKIKTQRLILAANQYDGKLIKGFISQVIQTDFNATITILTPEWLEIPDTHREDLIARIKRDPLGGVTIDRLDLTFSLPNINELNLTDIIKRQVREGLVKPNYEPSTIEVMLNNETQYPVNAAQLRRDGKVNVFELTESDLRENKKTQVPKILTMEEFNNELFKKINRKRGWPLI